jgi:hypothetical protein
MTTVGNRSGREIRYVCYEPLSALKCPHPAAHSVEVMLVPGGGVEPPRAEARRILSPLRLPVPPSRLYFQVPDSTTYLWLCSLFIQNDECATV